MNDGEWREERERAVWGPFGIASLVATHWLDDTPRAVDRAPGLWRSNGESAVGAVGDETVTLAPGEERRAGAVQLRGFARDGMIALRVLDPAGAALRGISTIERFPYDPDAVVRGVFHPTDVGAVDSLSVDGYRSAVTHDGVVSFSWDGALIGLAAHRKDDGSLFVVFSDATSGTESHRFRTLHLPPTDADGTVRVDLNRAYLPPCAFSDHYVCILPPASNRLSVALRAGEALVR